MILYDELTDDQRLFANAVKQLGGVASPAGLAFTTDLPIEDVVDILATFPPGFFDPVQISADQPERGEIVLTDAALRVLP